MSVLCSRLYKSSPRMDTEGKAGSGERDHTLGGNSSPQKFDRRMIAITKDLKVTNGSQFETMKKLGDQFVRRVLPLFATSVHFTPVLSPSITSKRPTHNNGRH